MNLSQSTNDVYPTAIKLAVNLTLKDTLAAMGELKAAFEAKEREFADVIKMGRTQLQDAVPMTLGQEFGAWGVMVGEDMERLREASDLLKEINLGATAIGTGLNSPPGYAELATAHAEGGERHPRGEVAQPRGGHPGLGVLRPDVGRHEARGREAEQDLQRPPPALLGPALRPARDRPARPCSPAPPSCPAR